MTDLETSGKHSEHLRFASGFLPNYILISDVMCTKTKFTLLGKATKAAQVRSNNVAIGQLHLATPILQGSLPSVRAVRIRGEIQLLAVGSAFQLSA